FSMSRIVSGDETAAWKRALRITTRSVDEFALDDQRSGGLGDLIFEIGSLRFPHDLSGPGVESDHEGIIGGQKNLVLVDGNVAISISRAGQIADVLGQFAFVLPEQIAVGRVERLDDV